MDRLNRLRAFVAVAEKLSFAEASRALALSATAVSRAVAGLEDDLGAALFRRTTRSVLLTPEGEAYLEHARRALDELDDAARSIRGEQAEPRGLLVVTAPVVFGRLHILPVVSRVLAAYPALVVRLSLTDRLVRIVDEGVDIAVRIGALSDSALLATKVGEVRRVLIASPDYLDRRGTPSRPEELSAHDLIAFEAFALNSEWRFGPEGRIIVRLTPRLVTDSVQAAIDAAIAGVGVARALSYQTAADVETDRLRYLLPAMEPAPWPVHLVYQANRLRSPNVRAFLDEARRSLKGQFAA